MIYYNEIDPFCCRVLRARIADGRLPDGVVDSRSIQDVPADELKQYKQIHLFAGIGGFPLALELADFGRDRSIITGGFPCQDISTAGKGAGLEGERSGLWWETLAAISELRPDVIFVENVSALLVRGLEVVLGSLAPLGYRLEWHCVPARYVGAPHQRDRIWIVGVRDVADTEGHRVQESGDVEVETGKGDAPRESDGSSENVADTDGKRPQGKRTHTDKEGREGPILRPARLRHGAGDGQGWWGAQCRLGIHPDGLRSGLDNGCGGWECGIPRVTRGQKDRAKRLKSLGNAIVPQCAAFVLNHVLGDWK